MNNPQNDSQDTKVLKELTYLGSTVRIIETPHTIEISCPKNIRAAVQNYLEAEGIMDEIFEQA